MSSLAIGPRQSLAGWGQFSELRAEFEKALSLIMSMLDGYQDDNCHGRWSGTGLYWPR